MVTPDPLIVALSSFARTLATRIEITDVLYELTERVAEVTAVPAAGVSLLQDGKLRHAISLNQMAATIEGAQEHAQAGPCVDAYRTMEAVTIVDLHDEPERWPEVASAALAAGVVAIAGIPFHDGHQPLGVLNLYDVVPRHWSDTDLAHARMLTDMATSYMVNASQLQRERRAKEQLQHVLESSGLIEQAKGILTVQNGISVNKAFELLRAHARSHNVPIRSVADAIVNLGLRL